MMMLHEITQSNKMHASTDFSFDTYLVKAQK